MELLDGQSGDFRSRRDERRGVRGIVQQTDLRVLVAVIASLLGLLHLEEHWIKYRATAESLRREKLLFLTQTEPYDKGDAFHLLVQRVEALLSTENTEWVRSVTKPLKGESPD